MFLPFLGIAFWSTLLHASPGLHPETVAPATASLEIGTDSLQRRYFRPRLRFDFPLDWGIIFLEMNYHQRINSQLQGEVDFWLLGGAMIDVSSFSRLEVGLNHMSRHVTSVPNPKIFDVNEILGRFWIHSRHVEIGLGGGGFIGGKEAYDNLLALNLRLPKILDTEFGLSAEAKLINFKEILHDFEFSIGLSKSIELFVRNSRHYNANTTTYLGMRIRSDEDHPHFLKKLKLRAGTLPSDGRYKFETKTEFYLEFLESPSQRLQILLNSRIPILENQEILGPFRPEKIAYPLVLEYERKISADLLAIGYIDYKAKMPLDVDLPFTSTLGFGLGIANQSFFEKLDKRLRFVVSGGRNFTHVYDAEARIGVNTLREPMNFGADAGLHVNSEELNSSLEIFAEFGGEIKARLFLNGCYTDFFNGNASRAEWRIGFELIRWF